jgi:hypothetical protein
VDAHDDAPALLADYVIRTCGEDLALDVFEAFASPDLTTRARATSALYWHHDRATWRSLDDVLRLHRFETLRRATVVGLAARFGVETPRLVESDREAGRRRTRDALFRKAARHYGDVPGAGGQPSHRRRSA